MYQLGLGCVSLESRFWVLVYNTKFKLRHFPLLLVLLRLCYRDNFRLVLVSLDWLFKFNLDISEMVIDGRRQGRQLLLSAISIDTRVFIGPFWWLDRGFPVFYHFLQQLLRVVNIKVFVLEWALEHHLIKFLMGERQTLIQFLFLEALTKLDLLHLLRVQRLITAVFILQILDVKEHTGEVFCLLDDRRKPIRVWFGIALILQASLLVI